MHEHQSTPGEKIIEYFLEDQGIKYEREVNIPKLEGDSKAYRVADFYLPRYKVYVEFLGKWNNEKNKQGYLQKQDVYRLNRIPCVDIYPDNLGILNDIFRMRLEEQLNNYPELKWHWRLYTFDKLKKLFNGCLTLWAVGALMIIILRNLLNGQLIMDSFAVIAILVLSIACIALLVYGGNLIFRVKK